jgi:cysteine desulfuration protein SufE
MTIAERQAEIIDEFEMFDDWMDKYEHIIELGKDLPLIDAAYKDEDHKIRGCQSQVWLHAAPEGDKLRFTADSDAIITKGLISLMVRVLDDQPAAEIANTELSFIEKIGLHEHLSPTRSNGLRSMVKQMKLYGIAQAAQQNAQANG